MWLTPKEFTRVWSCFACERGISQWVCNIQIRVYFANIYVYNALHRATLANYSHVQYVSRLRLGFIWISVKAYIDITLYDEPFVTSIIVKHILIPLRIILTNVQWSTPRSLLYPFAKLMARYTIGLVYSMTYFIEPMAEAFGMTFILSLYLLPWSGFESYSTSHLTIQARTLSLTDPFWTPSKSCQGMYSLKKLIKCLYLSL